MGGCCAVKGLSLWGAGADCLLVLVKASGEAASNGQTGDGEAVFNETCAECGDIDRTAGMGEGVFGAERGGVRFLKGGGVEKFKTRS